MTNPVENCPKPETEIRERAWTAEQAIANLLDRALDAAAFLNAIKRNDRAEPLREAVHAVWPESAKSMDARFHLSSAFAATLWQQAEQPAVAVSGWDGEAYANMAGELESWKRRALQAEHFIEHEVQGQTFMGEPLLRAPAESPCSLSEALNVIENWSMHGNTLAGDDVGRFRALADKIAPAEQGGRVDERKFSDEDIRLALDYSRNYATARPDISPTAKEHVLGLCNRLESLLADRAALAQNAQGEAVAWQHRHKGYPDEWKECTREEFAYTKKHPDCPREGRALYLHAERARVPDGWVLVPREPTEAMGVAYLEAARIHAASGAEDAMRFSPGGYSAMLAARPSQPEESDHDK